MMFYVLKYLHKNKIIELYTTIEYIQALSGLIYRQIKTDKLYKAINHYIT